MLKIFICPECYNIRMVSKKPNAVCLHCSKPLVECDMEYSEYIKLTPNERESFKEEYQKNDKKEDLISRFSKEAQDNHYCSKLN